MEMALAPRGRRSVPARAKLTAAWCAEPRAWAYLPVRRAR